MVDPHGTFLQEFLHVAIAQRIAVLPLHGAEDNGRLRVAPCEQGGLTPGQSPVTGIDGVWPVVSDHQPFVQQNCQSHY